MFNISRLKRIVLETAVAHRTRPSTNLFVFSDIDGGDFVSFDLQKWETKFQDYREGDAVNVVKSNFMSPYEYDAMYEIYRNIFEFNNMRFESFESKIDFSLTRGLYSARIYKVRTIDEMMQSYRLFQTDVIMCPVGDTPSFETLLPHLDAR